MIKKFTLQNGLKVVYENINTIKTISVGVWIGSGSFYENNKNNGISHFIEHILFKGTENRTAKEIATEIEAIGGQINAFTAKEYTCYYVRVLDSFLEKALDILSDLILHPILKEEDIEKEKSVIKEEINMGKEDPEEILFNELNNLIWKGSSLSYPIAGTLKTVESINKTLILDHMKKYYIPNNTVIAVAGNFDEDNLINLINKYFINWEYSNLCNNNKNILFNKGIKIKNKKIDQTQLCLAFEGIGQSNLDVYKLILVSNILGGGMSSRLFQKIREELGLVYSINSFLSTYKNTGAFLIYAGMNPKNLQKVYELIINELENLIRLGVTEDELLIAKQQVKGAIIFGLENTSSRMSNIGKNQLLLDKIFDIDEVINIIDNISINDVFQIIKNVFTKEFSVTAVGNKKDIDLEIFNKRKIS